MARLGAWMPSELDMQRGFFRRIYAGFIWGKRINSVSMEAEAWFWRLNAIADDYGNLPGDHERVFRDTSGRRRVTVEQVAAWINELIAAGLVACYRAEDDDFLHIIGFCERQPAAAKNGKRVRRFPASPHDGETSPDPVREVNPSESKEFQVDPGESKCNLGIQAHKDKYKDNTNTNGQTTQTAVVVDATRGGVEPDPAKLEALQSAGVGIVKATELASRPTFRLESIRRVADQWRADGKPPTGALVAAMQTAAFNDERRAKKRGGAA